MNSRAPTSPRIVSRKTLLTVSAIADGLDLLGLGLMPGPWSLLIDLPVTVIHFLYAGPKAFVVLAEYLPGVGMLPCYTLAALFYPKESNATVEVASMPVASPPVPASPAPRSSRPAAAALPTLIADAVVVPSVPPDEAGRGTSPEERLHRLAELRQRGLISDEELAAKRQQILGEL